MIEVVEAGGLATLQDAGRFGWRRFGVPAAGPMDRFAFQAANLLVGNASDAVSVEVGAGDITLRAMYDCVIAATGAGYQLSINVWDFPLWGSYFVRGGWTIQLTKSGFGMWGYLAVLGGFAAERALGSQSTYLRGRFGGLQGRRLQPGDVLTAAATAHNLMEAAGRALKEEARPAYRASPTVDVILGPQSNEFSEEQRSIFTSSSYRVSASSDRMGYRLEGARINAAGSAERTSEGLTPGSIQVPSDGQPIAMMADSAPTGGYPKIACVTSADMPLLAQCMPGTDEVRFHAVSVDEAQARYRVMMEGLKHGIVEAEE